MYIYITHKYDKKSNINCITLCDYNAIILKTIVICDFFALNQTENEIM